MNDIKNSFESLSLLHWTIGIVAVTLSWFIYIFRYFKLQCRFAKNLKRTVYFLKTSPQKTLQTEKDLIKKICLFNIENDIIDISKEIKPLQNLKPLAAFIVGYDPDYADYKELFDEAKSKKIPVIIFANPGEIKNDEHWKIFNGYIYCDVTNTSNRISVILLNILMII